MFSAARYGALQTQAMQCMYACSVNKVYTTDAFLSQAVIISSSPSRGSLDGVEHWSGLCITFVAYTVQGERDGDCRLEAEFLQICCVSIVSPTFSPMPISLRP